MVHMEMLFDAAWVELFILTYVRILSTHRWMKHVDVVHYEFRIEITLFELETQGMRFCQVRAILAEEWRYV